MSAVVTDVVAEGFRFIEAPRWYDGHLYFCDMHDGAIHRLEHDGSTTVLARWSSQLGGLGWLPDGTLLVVAVEDRQVLQLEGNQLLTYADLSPLCDSLLNDMWVDEAGRAYVGEMGFDIHAFNALATAGRVEDAMATFRPGNVYVVESGRVPRPATAAPLMFPNGIMTSPKTGELVVAESFGLKLSAWTVADDGSLIEPRDLAVLGWAPDGICVNGEGQTWVADPTNGRAVLVDADGQLLQEIPLAQKCISLALGGRDGRTLYIATAGSTDPHATAAERSARVESVRV